MAIIKKQNFLVLNTMVFKNVYINLYVRLSKTYFIY